DYVAAFNQHAARVHWDQQALIAAFRRGLRGSILRAAATFEWPNSLVEFQSDASRITNALDEAREQVNEREPRQPVRRANQRTTPASHGRGPPVGERKRLTPQEKEERIKKKLCLYCGKAGHFRNECP
ncbi:hypothetical protein M407DRAFT_58939, partial [Tulasnella calospora MUT 4182]